MIDGKWERDVAHVAGAVDVVEPTGPTEVMLVTGAKSWVIQTPHVGVEKAIQGNRVGNVLATYSFYFISSVG